MPMQLLNFRNFYKGYIPSTVSCRNYYKRSWSETVVYPTTEEILNNCNVRVYLMVLPLVSIYQVQKRPNNMLIVYIEYLANMLEGFFNTFANRLTGTHPDVKALFNPCCMWVMSS